jgi:hypothetical protein
MTAANPALTQVAPGPVAPATVAPSVVAPGGTGRRAKIAWAWARAFGGVAILAVLVWQVGTGPFLDGIRVIDVSALVMASAIGVLTTVCSAWRWSLVAAGLGVRLPLRGAVAAYYRSQFLNGSTSWRVSRSWRGSSWLAQAVRAVGSDIRDGLFAHRNWVAIVATSTVVLFGHLATFLVAARTAGATAPLSRLVPLTLLALLAMALPLSIAGWGPREGVAAWAFAAAGLTATQGVATAVTYGVLALVASLPGAVVLVAQWSAGARSSAGERRG